MTSQTPRSYSDAWATDRLVAGLTQLVSETLPLAQGQALPRGAVLGRVTASGKLTLSTAAATDGSQVPYGVLADDADATLTDVLCGVYVKGEFNQNALTFGAGQTPVTVHDALRDAGIYLKTPVAAY